MNKLTDVNTIKEIPYILIGVVASLIAANIISINWPLSIFAIVLLCLFLYIIYSFLRNVNGELKILKDKIDKDVYQALNVATSAIYKDNINLSDKEKREKIEKEFISDSSKINRDIKRLKKSLLILILGIICSNSQLNTCVRNHFSKDSVINGVVLDKDSIINNNLDGINHSKILKNDFVYTIPFEKRIDSLITNK